MSVSTFASGTFLRSYSQISSPFLDVSAVASARMPVAFIQGCVVVEPESIHTTLNRPY